MHIFILSSAHAQNVQRIEEEIVKDQERKAKIEEYIINRELEAKQLLERPITLEEMQNKNLVQ